MAMHACLAALAHQLAEAQKLAVHARNAMERHERNLAIGTVMPLEQRLPECDALLRAVLTLHTWRNGLPSDAELAEKGGVA
jgi:hypothetical protein